MDALVRVWWGGSSELVPSPCRRRGCEGMQMVELMVATRKGKQAK